MDNKLVYRIEDEGGLGPFQGLPEGVDWWHFNADSETYPTPANDPGFDQDELRDRLRGRRLWEVGCSSEQQLRHWFTKRECAAMAKAGYLLATFAVPPGELFEGSLQVVFDRDAAECLNRQPCTALYARDRKAA